MKRLRNSIIWFALFLGSFYIIDTFVGDGKEVVHLQPFVFFLALLIAMILIWMSFWKRISLILGMLVGVISYFTYRLVFINTPTMFLGMEGYITIIELVFLLGVIYLSNQVAKNIGLISQIIDVSILPNPENRVHVIEQEEGNIEKEFVRARRYQYPISTIVVQPGSIAPAFPVNADFERLIIEISKNIKKRYLFAGFSRIISNLSRSSDYVVTLDDSERVLIVSPEASAENAQLLVKRLQLNINANLGMAPVFGVASFPDDGPTLEAVLKKAIDRISESSKPTSKP